MTDEQEHPSQPPLARPRPAFSGEKRPPRRKREEQMSEGAQHELHIPPSEFAFDPARRATPNQGSPD